MVETPGLSVNEPSPFINEGKGITFLEIVLLTIFSRNGGASIFPHLNKFHIHNYFHFE